MIGFAYLQTLLARAVAETLNRDGCDVRLSVSQEDSRLWSLWHDGDRRDVATGPDPVALLIGYLVLIGATVPPAPEQMTLPEVKP